MEQNPSATSAFVHSVALDLVFTLLTCGLYNLWVNARQMRAMNHALGVEKYAFWPWLIFSILTCGIYHLYFEYQMSRDLQFKMKEFTGTEVVLVLILIVLSFTPVVDAIQQAAINRYYGEKRI